MSIHWKEESNRIKEHFGIADDYELFCAGNSADIAKDGVEQIADFGGEVNSQTLIEHVVEMKAPIGYMVCLFVNSKGNHIVVTPDSKLFSGKHLKLKP